jgi:hypothetical protein
MYRWWADTTPLPARDLARDLQAGRISLAKIATRICQYREFDEVIYASPRRRWTSSSSWAGCMVPVNRTKQAAVTPGSGERRQHSWKAGQRANGPIRLLDRT